MEKYLEKIRRYGSGARAWQRVAEIAGFHRIQCSTGFRAAAEHCCKVLQKQGIQAEVHPYPFDEKRWYWTQKSFLEWDCRGAYCDLLDGEKGRLADFEACPTSVMQKSYPCDFRKEPLEIVLMDRGSRKEAYEDMDLSGKLLFLREPFGEFMDWAFTEKGAVGFVTDYLREVPGVRTRQDLYDITNYTSFWWKDSQKEPHIFGFVLTPREGDRLAVLCREMEKEGKRPRAACYVDASLYPGTLENVEAFLPGASEEEVLVIAHLCHPKPSANDNASGAAVAMELLKTLHDLLEQGELPPLKRGVRVCLVPEFSGTYPYLCRREGELSRIVGGINLDMVGGRQEKGYGPLVISDQPWSSSPLVTALAELVLEEVQQQSEVHKKDNFVPLFNGVVRDFTSGSDHIILSDPKVNIPCPMLGQWPDLYYHTSGDTPQQVDPQMLHNSLCIAAGYVYALASFGEKEAERTLLRLRSRYERAMEKLMQQKIQGEEDLAQLGEKARAITAFYQAGCRQAAALCPERQTLARETAGRMEQRQREVLEDLEAPQPKELEGSYVPVRLFMGPIVHLEDYALEEEGKQAAYQNYVEKYQKRCPGADLFELLLTYAMDGQRTVEECARLASLEAGSGSIELAKAYCDLLEAYGILEKQKGKMEK